MRILLISPYHSGSHRAWAEGYARYSRHAVEILSLPGRLWKWRMQGGAVALAAQIPAQRPDLILATDMLDVATFAALTRRQTADLPLVLYMHENQLTYPLPKDPRKGPMRRNWNVRERPYVLINWRSQLTADHILFNSHHHLESWFDTLPRFLRHYPEYDGTDTVNNLQAKSRVLPVGIDFARLDRPAASAPVREPAGQDVVPLILWNQRWEFDKNPAAFFDALRDMDREGRPFRLAICGENFQQNPAVFTAARNDLGRRIIHYGYAPADRYRELLHTADITLSTADHEFFGISILEAIYARTFPILPHRLSYPELIPAAHHDRCLYHTSVGLREHLRWALSHPTARRRVAAALRTAVSGYNWSAVAVQYDQLFTQIAASS